MRLALVLASSLFASLHLSPPVDGATTVVWDGTDVTGDVTIPAGQHVLLRNRNIIRGQLSIAAGASLVADPSSDVYLQFGNLEVNGTLAIGSAATPYAKSATLALGCALPTAFPSADDRRNGLNVRAGGSLLLYGQKATALPWTRLNATALASATCLTLADDVARAGWAIGDTIVVTTTDFDPLMTERRTITRFRSTCVEIDRPLQWMHYGEFAQGIDQRAEVGLLNRNIQLVGCTNNGNVGGHLKFNKGFQTGQVQGVSIQSFGQGDIIGRYAVHFHMCGNVAATNSFLKGNAIFDSYMRAVTIHGTQSVLVEANVAYNITGHAMFLEDGSEFNNTFRGNLVATVRQKASGAGAFRLGSDDLAGLSAFWITNPDNSFVDNVVAGVEGTGYWIHTRTLVKPLSFATGLYPTLTPFTVPLRLATGNRAHSVWNGFRIDSVEFDADDQPLQDYGNAFGAAYQPSALTVISNFVVHHARQGGWFRIFEIVLDGWQLADCREGVQFLTTGNTPTMPINGTVRNSHFVGSSSNRGNEYTSAWQVVNYVEARSESNMLVTDLIKMAITLYDGPHYVENCTFENYISYPCFNYYTTALGARAFNTFMMASTTRSLGNTFINTDFPVYLLDRQSDGGKTTLVLDPDGSISGQIASTILPDWDFYYTPYCIRNAGYGLACPHRYNNIEIVQIDPDGTNLAKYGELYALRANVNSPAPPTPPGLSFQGQYIPAGGGYLYHPSLAVGGTYIFGFTSHTPATLRVNIVNGQQGDTHTMAFCYPRGSAIRSVVAASSGAALTRATSLLDASCVNCYFYDTPTDLLVLRLRQTAARTDDAFPCPRGSGCEGAIVQATFNSASTGVADCAARSAPLARVDDAWIQTSFSTLETFSLDMPLDLGWCTLGDACLEAIDVGNRNQGILAYTDSPCQGIGCYSAKCRYCKLSYSQSNQPFLPCPFEAKRAANTSLPSTPTATAPIVDNGGTCPSYVNVGDITAGISAVNDTTCAIDNNSTGCFLSKCRYCTTRATPASNGLVPCETVASNNCASMVAVGDQSVGISGIADPTCPRSMADQQIVALSPVLRLDGPSDLDPGATTDGVAPITAQGDHDHSSPSHHNLPPTPHYICTPHYNCT
ncbi:hypothetical protein As57867_001750, partial [Aphanomyces stellatus]